MEQKQTRSVGSGVIAAAAACTIAFAILFAGTTYHFFQSGEYSMKGAVLVWAMTVGFVFAFAIVITIFVGLPLDALLRRMGFKSWFAYAIVGVTAAALLGVAADATSPDSEEPVSAAINWAAAARIGCFGGLAASAFWFVARRTGKM